MGRQIFPSIKEKYTGSHVKSMQSVVNNNNEEADFAAIDCVTYALVDRWRPELTRSLKQVASSRPFPALPYVTRIDTPDEIVSVIREALIRSVYDPQLDETRKSLLLGRIAKKLNCIFVGNSNSNLKAKGFPYFKKKQTKQFFLSLKMSSILLVVTKILCL